MQKYRVKYADISKPLDQHDFAIISGALSERGGFDGKVIKNILSQFGVQGSDLVGLKNIVSSTEHSKPLTEVDTLNAFLVCSLVSAALGEEELGTIRGYDRDEYYTTIRRLYHAIRAPMSSGA
jgi:hypothetical protein